MDLRSLANNTSRAINPNQTVTVLRSTGFTVGAGMKQVPTYAAPATGPAQIQNLDGVDLKQLDGLNIQGDIKTIFLRGSLAGVLRPNSTGGDLVQDADGKAWLVVKVLESWPTWTKAAIVLQGGIS